MATFLDIQTRVRSNVIDLPTAVTNAVPRFINRSMTRLQNKHNFIIMKASVTYTSSTVRVLNALPSDWKDWRTKPFYLDDTTGRQHELTVAPDRLNLQRIFDDQDDGAPKYLFVNADGEIELWPLSDNNSDFSDGEYRITIPYWKYLPELSADDDTNWFTVNAEQYLEDMATAYGFRMDWDMDRYEAWKADAMVEYGDVLRIDKVKQITVDTFAPHLDYYDPQVIR